MRYVLLLLVIAALVAGFLALDWKDAIFGDRESRETTDSPPLATVTPGDESGPDVAGRPAVSPVLFGRKPQDLRGVGAVTLRVVRYGENAPVAGAKVSLRGTGHGGEAVAHETATDRNGGAAFDGVAAGEGYSLRVDAPRETPQERADVRVAAGRTTDLGTVFVGARAALEGRVVDEKGAPVGGASVGVHRAEGTWLDLMTNFDELLATLDREPKPLATAESRPDGTFRVENLPPGDWTVVARAPGRLDARESATLGAKGLLSKPLVLVLGPGAVVAGKVVTEAGAGVAGARLAFFAEGSADPLEFLHGRIFAATRADGSFEAALRPELRRVRAVIAAEGHPTHVSEHVRVGDTDVRIVLHGVVPVDVRVVTKEGGRAVEGARVTLAVQMSEEDGSAATLFATTGPDGTAALACPAGKVVMLMASHPTLSGGFTNSQMRDNAATFAPFAVLEADFPDEIVAGRANRIDVRLSTGAALVGRVTDAAGSPIAGAEVSVAALMPVGGGRRSARSAADGSYRLEGVPSGVPFAVVVKAPGWTLRRADARVAGRPDASGEIAKDLTLHPSTTVRGRVVDPEGGGVGGAKVRVALASGMGGFDLGALGGPQATTADDGSYAIFDVGESGALEAMVDALAGEAEGAGGPVPKARETPKARVRVARDGYVDGESAEFAVAEGVAVEVPTVTLARGATVRGTVLDPAGNPLPHARLEARIERKGEGPRFSMPGLDRDQRAITTDVAGRFDLPGLPEGTVTLTATRSGFAAARRTVPVPASGEVAAADLRLRPERQVRGRAVGTDGRAVPGAVVLVEGLVGATGDDAYVTSVSERASRDGSFVLGGLPPGRVRLRARADGRVDAVVETETGDHSVDLVLAARSGSDAERLKEIDAEMKRLLETLLAAKSGEEQAALQQRYAALQQEKTRLEAKASGD